MDGKDWRAAGHDIMSRKELRPYMRRTNMAGALHFAAHLGSIGITGYLLYIAIGSWWSVPLLLSLRLSPPVSCRTLIQGALEREQECGSG